MLSPPHLEGGVGAVRAGAIGYLLKDTNADELRRSVKAAAQGQVHLSPEAAVRLMREVRAPEAPEPLTERETDVLRLLADGQSNKEIAHNLSIGEKTVNGQPTGETAIIVKVETKLTALSDDEKVPRFVEVHVAPGLDLDHAGQALHLVARAQRW